jgi:hypothetical protein
MAWRRCDQAAANVKGRAGHERRFTPARPQARYRLSTVAGTGDAVAMAMRLIALVIAMVCATGCGDSFEESDPPIEDANFAGAYSINFKNGDNACIFDGWTVDATSTGVPVTISQDGDQVTADVEGLAGTFLDLYLGSKRLAGTVEGNDVLLILLGQPRDHNGCVSVIDAEYALTLAGDAVSGAAVYTRAMQSGTCAFPAGCESHQTLSGSRVPQ